MEKLIEQVEILKKSLDNTTEVKNIIILNKKIKDSKELQEKINEYKERLNNNLKEEIYNDSLYKEYKEAETNLNILILKINKELKKINSKGKCGL
ncbi:unknown [Mycoplasma sp. CAG:877]|nr:unknown [Mycoplasma sp. CAG:877]